MADGSGIEIDVRDFAKVSVIDTCSIGHVLSSPRLMAATRRKKVWFLAVRYVVYEALVRPRSNPTKTESAIQQEFRVRLERKCGFSGADTSVADLQAMAAIPDVRKLGRGEIASMALARRMRIAFTTDDQKARRVSSRIGVEPVQTTPHLLGWLVYCGELTDGDVSVVVREHEARVPITRGQLSKYLNDAHIEACRCRLIENQPNFRAVPDGAKK